MSQEKLIHISELFFDLENFRLFPQPSQEEARKAMIDDQGKKLVALAKHIIEHGLSPVDPLRVLETNHNYTVIDGNRRLAAIQFVLNPGLAEGTPLYNAFKKLNAASANEIQQMVKCLISPSKEHALPWIIKKHTGKDLFEPFRRRKGDKQ